MGSACSALSIGVRVIHWSSAGEANCGNMPKSGCPVCNCFVSYTDDKVVPVAKSIASEDDTNMDVDVVAPISIKHGLLEIEIYCYLLVLIFFLLIRRNTMRYIENADFPYV